MGVAFVPESFAVRPVLLLEPEAQGPVGLHEPERVDVAGAEVEASLKLRNGVVRDSSQRWLGALFPDVEAPDTASAALLHRARRSCAWGARHQR